MYHTGECRTESMRVRVCEHERSVRLESGGLHQRADSTPCSLDTLKWLPTESKTLLKFLIIPRTTPRIPTHQHSITATWRYTETSITAKTLLDTVFFLNLIAWYCVKLRLLRKIKEWTIRFDAMYQHIPQAPVKMSFIFQVEGNAMASTSLEELILFSKSLSCHFVQAFVAATF